MTAEAPTATAQPGAAKSLPRWHVRTAAPPQRAQQPQPRAHVPARTPTRCATIRPDRPGDPGQERRHAGMGRAGGPVRPADLVDLPQVPAGRRRCRPRLRQRLGTASRPAGHDPGSGRALPVGWRRPPPAGNAAAPCAPRKEPTMPHSRQTPRSSLAITPRQPSRSYPWPSATWLCARRSRSHRPAASN